MAPIYSIEELKRLVTPVAEKYDARQLHLFGSFARGEADEDSDIDLRLDMGKTLGLFALSSFAIDLEEALDRKVDLLTTGALDEKFLARIQPEEVLLYAKQ